MYDAATKAVASLLNMLYIKKNLFPTSAYAL